MALLRTVCGDALQQGGRHYDLHNLYGWSQVALSLSSFYLLYAQSEPTLEGVRSALGTRGLILSRWEVSQLFLKPGSGRPSWGQGDGLLTGWETTGASGATSTIP